MCHKSHDCPQHRLWGTKRFWASLSLFLLGILRLPSSWWPGVPRKTSETDLRWRGGSSPACPSTRRPVNITHSWGTSWDQFAPANSGATSRSAVPASPNHPDLHRQQRAAVPATSPAGTPSPIGWWAQYRPPVRWQRHFVPHRSRTLKTLHSAPEIK